jgi:serine protease Do
VRCFWGATLSLLTGLPAGAQVAQNDDSTMQAITPRAGAPASFADLTKQLQPAVVNISTRQKVKVQGGGNPFAGTPSKGCSAATAAAAAARRRARRSRWVRASSSRPMAMSSPTTMW